MLLLFRYKGIIMIKEVVLVLVATLNVTPMSSKYLLVELEDTKYPMMTQRDNEYHRSQGRNVM